MTKRNEKLVEFPRQSARDIVTDELRDGAQQMLATAIDIEWDWPFADPVSQRWPLHQLQHQCPRAVLLLDAIDGGDARMVQTGENLRLPLEPGEPIRISRKRLGQDLQRDLPVQLGIGGLIDLAHAPLADEGGHVVVGDAGADLQSHETGVIEPILATYISKVYPVHRMASHTRTNASCEASFDGTRSRVGPTDDRVFCGVRALRGVQRPALRLRHILTRASSVKGGGSRSVSSWNHSKDTAT